MKHLLPFILLISCNSLVGQTREEVMDKGFTLRVNHEADFSFVDEEGRLITLHFNKWNCNLGLNAEFLNYFFNRPFGESSYSFYVDFHGEEAKDGRTYTNFEVTKFKWWKKTKTI